VNGPRTARGVERNAAFPALSVLTPSWVEPEKKDTVPVGVPLAELTVAVEVTL
jgi:hypothetical protein